MFVAYLKRLSIHKWILFVVLIMLIERTSKKAQAAKFKVCHRPPTYCDQVMLAQARKYKQAKF